jgi:hypothetical protein
MQTTVALGVAFATALTCLAQQPPDSPKPTPTQQAAVVSPPASPAASAPAPPATISQTPAVTWRDTPVRTYTDFTITPFESDPTKVTILMKTGTQTGINVVGQRGKNTDGTLSSSKFYLMDENGDYTEYERKEASVLPDGQQRSATLDVRGYIRNKATLQPPKFNYYTRVRPLEARVIEGTIQYWLKYADDKPPIQVHPFTRLGGGERGPLETIDPLPFLLVRSINRKAIQRLEFEANYSNFPTIWRAEATKDGGFVVIGGYDRPPVKAQMEEVVKAHGGIGKIQK